MRFFWYIAIAAAIFNAVAELGASFDLWSAPHYWHIVLAVIWLNVANYWYRYWCDESHSAGAPT